MAGITTGLALGIGSLVASVGGTVYSGLQQQQNAKNEQAIANYNAETNRQNEIQTRQEQAMNLDIEQQRQRQAIASQEAQLVGMGGNTSSTLAGLRTAWMNASTDLDALNYNYNTKANAFDNRVNMNKMQASVAKNASNNALIGTGLSALATGLSAGNKIWGNSITTGSKT